MSDERPFTLRQIDQARGDLYALQDDLDFIRVQLARLPTRNEVSFSCHICRGSCRPAAV